MIFNTNTDREGRVYYNCYSNIETEGTIALDKNIVVKGIPKLVLRKGASKFGDQLIFQFFIKEKINYYPKSTNHEVLEFYLPKREGFEFLQRAIEFFKETAEK